MEMRKAEEEARGVIVNISETVLVPLDEYPNYNFVGRVLGPRGMTVTQLEEDTDCFITLRGPSLRNSVHCERLDSEPLHVLISCTDYPTQCHEKMAYAVRLINALLHPSNEGMDEFRRNQMSALSLMRAADARKRAARAAQTPPRQIFMLVPTYFPIMQHSRPRFFLPSIHSATSYNNETVPFIRRPMLYPVTPTPRGQRIGSPMLPQSLPLPRSIINAYKQQYLQYLRMLSMLPLYHSGWPTNQNTR